MYLGIDLGTGTLKAAVFDVDGTMLSTAEEPYAVPLFNADTAEFDPFVWLSVCRQVVSQITARHGHNIAAIGIAGQMHGVVLTDSDGLPTRPAVLWPDHRATSVLDMFIGFDEQHPGTLGNPLVPGMAGPILAWLSRHEPDALQRASFALQPKDWLRMQLCVAQPLTDPSDASATLLYDIRSDAWSDELCERISVSRGLLPKIMPSTSVAGRLDPSIAAELNLREVPVVVGSGDAAAALLGAGIEETGTALINIGTGAQIMTPIAAQGNGRFSGHGIHQYRSASKVTPWYAMAAIANAGLALEWVRNLVGYSWDQVYGTANSVFACADTDPMFLPFMTNERISPHDVLRGGAWKGLTLAHDRDALVRSALRGVAFYIGLRSRGLRRLSDVKTAVLSGGAARHHGWVEVLATILGVSVAVPVDHHLTVRGAARLAAQGDHGDLPEPRIDREVSPLRGADVEGRLISFQADVDRYFTTSA